MSPYSPPKNKNKKTTIHTKQNKNKQKNNSNNQSIKKKKVFKSAMFHSDIQWMVFLGLILAWPWLSFTSSLDGMSSP